MVSLEAGAAHLPSISTFEASAAETMRAGGLLIKPEPTQLRYAIEQACAWGIEERRDRGRAARKLIEKRYSAAIVAQQWQDLYSELVR